MSRLEEIKRVNSKHIKQHYGTSAVPTEDFKWLIQRVEELEGQLKTKLSQWSRACQKKDEFELKSYCYKQALQEIGFHTVFGNVDWKQEYHELKIIARQELEVNSQ